MGTQPIFESDFDCLTEMNLLTDEALTEKQLYRLKDHKYSSSGKSILESKLQPFWNKVVEKVPLWIAPNLITLLGLSINFGAFVWLLFYNGRQAPPHVYYFNAVALFLYQTLDAIDGKQARRTDTQSPLGELFDHGCDSLSTIFVSLSVMITVDSISSEPFYFAVFIILCSHCFYCVHWVSYVTGTLHFGIFDVTEIQFAAMGVFTLTAMFGQEIWKFTPLFGFPLRYITYISLLMSILATWPKHVELATTNGAGMNGATVANTSIISPFGPVAAILIIGIQMAYRTRLYSRHPIATVLLITVSMAKITNKLIIASMTKSELNIWDTSLCPLLVMFLNQYWGLWLPENKLIYICLLWAVFNLAQYLISTYKQIAGYLNIRVLLIPSSKATKKD